MKKLFTLALVLLVALAGYSQVQKSSQKDPLKKVATMQKSTGLETLNFVQSEPNMTKSDGELDYSYYDWQSNQGARTWTYKWPDGKVSFAFTTASTETFADRGTAVGTYDAVNDEWLPSGGRIENEKTGFGSMARYGENGLVIAAHTSSNLGVYIVEDKDNITPNSVPASLYTNNASYTHPAVMTSGPNHDIIHVFAGNFDDSSIPFHYWRSSDGHNWDKSEVVLPYIEEGSDWGTNEYYFMQTTEDNCLALVINSAWNDGMVLYSFDDGETWERKLFYKHPNPKVNQPSVFLYPRWTSAQWGANGLNLVYEFNGSTGDPGSGSYYPGLGGVAYWSENMPYRGEGVEFGFDPNNPVPPVNGQPFVMDSAYVYRDIYASWWAFGNNATHDMWPEYFGFLAALDENGQPNYDFENITEFAIEDETLHGKYNSGTCAMPVLCIADNGIDMVAVWVAMDEKNQDGAGNFYYKMFASYSPDGGQSWSHQIQLTAQFVYNFSEFVYPQAALVGNTLVIAVQMDDATGTFVQSDEEDPTDCLYQGMTFDLSELFEDWNTPENPVQTATHMTIFPNPATDQLNVTLSRNANISIYNLTGQMVQNVEGHIGGNVIDLSGMNSGIYFINADGKTQKFIVK